MFDRVSHCQTSFVKAEQAEVSLLDPTTSVALHVGEALGRCREVAARAGAPGLVLTSPGAVAWATGGVNVPIDRAAATDVVWLAIGPERATLVTTNVEAPRIAAEHAPEARGLDLVAVPWWDAAAPVLAAADVLGLAPARLGSDGHADFGVDLTVALTRARLALDAWERDRLRELARDATQAVQEALRQWMPGDSDRSVAARIAGAVEGVGAQAPVLLVGGDDRLRSYRHPVAVGQALHRTVMAVLVAARHGQHVALTRYVSSHPVDAPLADGLAASRRIHRRALAACRPGSVIGQVVTDLAAGYADAGADGAWKQHYQGGPIGYAQREFELAPGQTRSPWWRTVLPAGSAVAWNPSLPGGAKDEDTYLVRDGEPELITTTADWPLADEHLPARPAVLLAGS